MKPARCNDQFSRSGRPVGRIVFAIVTTVIAVLVTRDPIYADDTPRVKDSGVQKVVGGASSREFRRVGRKRHASSNDSTLAGGQSKSMPRQRQSRRARRAGKRPHSTDETPIQLHVQGSYELDLGFGNVIRGEGSTTVQFDRATVEKLHADSVRKLGEAAPVAKDLLRVIVTLPETVERTAEILKIFSDPETQQSMRQVEQVLRLIPRSGARPDS